MEYQVMTDGTFLIKSLVWSLEDELDKQAVTIHQVPDYSVLAEKFSDSKQNAEAMSVYLNLGNVLFSTGRTVEARESYFIGLALAEQNKCKWFVSAFQSNIGHLNYSEGNLEEAITYFNLALPGLKEGSEHKDNTPVLLGIILKMESIYNQKKELDRAIECLQQALILFKNTDGKIGTARCLNNLGLIHVATKNHDQALNNFREALAIFRELGSREDEAQQLGNLGSVYRDISKHDLALKHYNESLAVFKELGNELGVANELGNIGYILFMKGDYNSALTYFLQAEKLYLKLGVASRAEMTRKNIDNLLDKII